MRAGTQFCGANSFVDSLSSVVCLVCSACFCAMTQSEDEITVKHAGIAEGFAIKAPLILGFEKRGLANLLIGI